ncbi:hypothetical protein [Hymenobacter bucti]|uniref:Uncharacterized protein n=1 Tax=Hymenobacter bucti TaxID=1844114 RepID=A0ABW4R1I5_9BACT
MDSKNIVILLSLSLTCACTHTCEEGNKEFLALEPCNIVITENKSAGRSINIKGYNPNTNSIVKYNQTKGLLIFVYEAIAIGDTLLKPETSNWFLLKKHNFNIKFYSKCGSSGEYLGVVQDTISKCNK